MKESEARQDRRYEDASPAQRTASDTFQIGRATAQDAAVISWHPARMFQDMEDVSGDALKSYKEIITCCKNEQIDRLVLHASDEGPSLYERLGFTESNERRFVDVSQFCLLNYLG
jgi:hypothetical protein